MAQWLPDVQVTDYIDAGIRPSRWLTFNIADAAITIGLAIPIWNSFRGEPRVTDAR